MSSCPNFSNNCDGTAKLCMIECHCEFMHFWSFLQLIAIHPNEYILRAQTKGEKTKVAQITASFK